MPCLSDPGCHVPSGGQPSLWNYKNHQKGRSEWWDWSRAKNLSRSTTYLSADRLKLLDNRVGLRHSGHSTTQWINSLELPLLPGVSGITQHGVRLSTLTHQPASCKGARLNRQPDKAVKPSPIADRRMYNRNPTLLILREDEAFYPKVAELDKLLSFKLSLLVAHDLRPDKTQHNLDGGKCKYFSLVYMLDKSMQAAWSSHFNLLTMNGGKQGRRHSKYLLGRIKRPASIFTFLDHSIRDGIVTYYNHTELYHAAHLCLLAALCRKVTRLEESVASLRGKDSVRADIFNSKFQGGNLNLQTQEINLIAGSKHSWGSQAHADDASAEKLVTVGLLRLDASTADKISRVEERLVRRIASLTMEDLAAFEEVYISIRDLYAQS